ncbi:XdhC family protein [Aneurinibacillus uraniidurans]|uniref:XdhC family protein n=1 Tax=Aneurinibacillus uraniidurans TaxID=2966586 RepID=UPI00234BB3FE|nr:XdhC family protein [Aneurinibacillus sp. B1]WCN36275.1 XdhC family protein [Aneurinibacillus sp. B1]
MDDIHRILEAIKHSSERSALATIIHVEGSAYRKEGTSMLFQESGAHIGVLSAGCLEVDLAARMDEIFDEGTPCSLVFDMRAEDDLSWGQGAGCNGVIRVLLEPIDHNLREHLGTLKRYLDSGMPVIVVKKLTPDLSVSDYVFITDHEQTFGEWQGEIPVQLKHQQKSGMEYIPELSSYSYIHRFWPKSRFIIFGAGMDAKPLASFAADTGFSVIVSDWRPALCSSAHFPTADMLLLGFPTEIMEKLVLTPFDSVIIMTHHFGRDKELLRWLMKKEVCYLGILGPRKRTARLLDGADLPHWIHSPVGLPIGAEGPEEIAISILADVISVLRQQGMKKAVSP